MSRRRPYGRDVAVDLDEEFVFDLVGVLGESAPHAAVLGQHHQAAGVVVERHQWRQPDEVALQQAHAGGIVRPMRRRRDQRRGGLAAVDRVEARRLVQQDRGRLGGSRTRVGIEFDVFVRHHVLRRLDDLAIHRYPAALDVALGIGARAAGQFGDVLGEADGVGHGTAWQEGRVV